MVKYDDIDTVGTIMKAERVGRKLHAIGFLFSEATQDSTTDHFYDGMAALLYDLGQELLDLEEKPILKNKAKE